jgi:hypothetical protein
MSREHSTPLLAVYNGRTCCGFLLRRGRDGVEAFDSDERSLGLFPTEQEAAAALEAEAAA